MNIVFQDRKFQDITQSRHMRALEVDTLTKHIQGGPKRATFSAPDDGLDPLQYLKLIRYPVKVYSDGKAAWWGFVYGVNAGGVSVSLDGVYNGVRVHYGELDTNGEVTTSAETDWINDIVSRDDLGSMQFVTEMDTATAATAAARAAIFLHQHSNPTYSFNSGRGISIECLGWGASLDMQGEEQIDTGAIIHAEIEASGADYNVNDVVSVDDGTGGTITVTAVDGSGGVTAFTLTTPGTLYSTGVHTTTHAAGSGLTLNIITAVGTTIDWTDLALGILQDGYAQFLTAGNVTKSGQTIAAVWDFASYSELFKKWFGIGYTDGRQAYYTVNDDRSVDIYPEPAESVTHALDQEQNLYDSTNRLVPPEVCKVGVWATLRGLPSVSGGIAVARPALIEEAEYSASSGKTRYRFANTPNPFDLTGV